MNESIVLQLYGNPGLLNWLCEIIIPVLVENVGIISFLF